MDHIVNHDSTVPDTFVVVVDILDMGMVVAFADILNENIIFNSKKKYI